MMKLSHFLKPQSWTSSQAAASGKAMLGKDVWVGDFGSNTIVEVRACPCVIQDLVTLA